jgi:hypothetical protein
MMLRKRAVPPVGEIKARNVEHEHGVVLARASSKRFAQHVPKTVFTMFDLHCDIFVRLQP